VNDFLVLNYRFSVNHALRTFFLVYAAAVVVRSRSRGLWQICGTGRIDMTVSAINAYPTLAHELATC
jgi:hypothetical protein